MSLRQGYVSGPDGRGTLDIIWSCLVTMFLGSWSALFLNLPGEQSGKKGFFKNKLRWMVVILFFPEMITGIAAEQWRSARQSVEDFKKLRAEWQVDLDSRSTTLAEEEKARLAGNLDRIKASPWSMRHAFFADMGGILLKCVDCPPFPITAHQMSELVGKGWLAYPSISQRAIWDKNKADGFARLLTIVQIVWFSIQCIGRAAQNLAVTTLELSTLSFIFCTANTLFFWIHKPLDVEEPIQLECDTPLETILFRAGRDLADGFLVSPLEYINPPISSTSMVAPFWVGFDVTFGKPKRKVHDVTERLSNTRTIPPRGLIRRDIAYGSMFVLAYFGIHLSAWNFTFPTYVEQLLWRVATFVLLGLSLLYFAVVVISNYIYKPFARMFLGMKSSELEGHVPLEVAYKLPKWLAVAVHVPFFVVYCIARLYIIVEGFCHLRALSETVYSTIKWQNFVPHFS